MAIKIFNAKDFSSKLKVTIQATGKLGFTEATTAALNLSEKSYILLGFDEANHDELYLALTTRSERAFQVCKSGNYYYLPTRKLFLSLGFDFQNYNIMFDLTREPKFDDELQGTVYKMTRRELERRKKE